MAVNLAHVLAAPSFFTEERACNMAVNLAQAIFLMISIDNASQLTGNLMHCRVPGQSCRVMQSRIGRCPIVN